MTGIFGYQCWKCNVSDNLLCSPLFDNTIGRLCQINTKRTVKFKDTNVYCIIYNTFIYNAFMFKSLQWDSKTYSKITNEALSRYGLSELSSVLATFRSANSFLTKGLRIILPISTFSGSVIPYSCRNFNCFTN